MKNVNQTIAETFREVAEYLETGRSGRRPHLLLTGMGSEHGEKNSMQAAVMAARVGLDVSYIGTLEGEGVTTVPVADEAGHRKMVELLEERCRRTLPSPCIPFPHRRVHRGPGGNPRSWQGHVPGHHHRHLQRQPSGGHDPQHHLRHHHR